MHRVMKEFSTTGSFCSHFQTCSGCLFHPKEKPPAWKEFIESSEIRDLLHKPELYIGDIFFCRYKARLAVRLKDGKPAIGLFKKRSHDVVDIPNCQMHHPAIQRAVCYIKEWMEKENISAYQENMHRGLLRYLQLIVDRKTEKVQLVLVCNCQKEDFVVDRLKKSIKSLYDNKGGFWHSIWINFQPLQTNTILGAEWVLCDGQRMLWQYFLGNQVAFLPGAFVQAHLPLFEKMIEKIVEYAKGATSILELFGGVGVIGICLSEEKRSVTIVENNPCSYESFCKTEEKLSTDTNYYLEDVNAYLEKRAVVEDLVVVDPPRKGLSETAIEALSVGKAKKLIYVSCNEKSFLQDVKKLKNNGWNIIFCDGYLFFPGTDRFEVLALLEKKKSG